MSNTLGKNIRFTLFGESHNEVIGGVLDGIPGGIPIDMSFINEMLERRKPDPEIGTARKENDEVMFSSGVLNGFSTGDSICFMILNEDVSDTETIYEFTPRPGHADYTQHLRSGGFEDSRGGGHLSGRLTAPIVVAGAIVLQALEGFGINVRSRIFSIAGIQDSTGELTRQAIIAAKNSGDSVGGIIETTIEGFVGGEGAPYFDSIESVISSAVFSIPGVKGIEFGLGFAMADKFGSEVNDEFYLDDEGHLKTKTNNNGGINGGIANGMPVTFKCVIKPTPSIAKEQNTVDMVKKAPTTIKIEGRNDPCIVPRACVVIEAVTALAVADIMFTHIGEKCIRIFNTPEKEG